MGSPSQRAIPHRGATNGRWQPQKAQSSEAQYLPPDSISDHLEGYGNYTCEDWRSTDQSQGLHIAFGTLRKSLSQDDLEILRRRISHGSNDAEDGSEFMDGTTCSEYWREWCKLFGDENHAPVSSEPEPSSGSPEQDIDDTIQELLLNPVTEASQGLTGPKDFSVGVKKAFKQYLKGECSTRDLRSDCLPEGLRRPLLTSIEKHRDTVSSRSTDWENINPDLVLEYDHDSDDEQEPAPEEWYRNAPAPSQLSSMTPSAEVRDAYVSLGGRVKSLVGCILEEPPSPPDSNYRDLKPLPPPPPAGATSPPRCYRPNILSRRSSLQTPPSGLYHGAPRTSPKGHVASQIRMPLPPQSARSPIREFLAEKPLPTEPLNSSWSPSTISLDESQIHPLLRSQYKLARPRYSSSGSGNSTCFSPLPPPISAYNTYQNKTRVSGSSQSSQPARLRRRHSYAQFSFMQSPHPSISHPSTTVSGLDSSRGSYLSYAQPDTRPIPESERYDITYTRCHSVENQLDVGGTTSHVETALEIPKLRRHNTDESEMLQMQAVFDAGKEQIMRNIQMALLSSGLEETERSSQSLQHKSSTQSKTPMLSEKLSLKHLPSRVRLLKYQRNVGSTPALVSNSTPALLSDIESLGATLGPSRSASQSSGRRSSSIYSQELSSVVSRENQSMMEELMEEVGIKGAQRPKGGPLRKVFDLHSKLSGHRDKVMLPTSSEKAARVLGGLPGYAPSVMWKKRVKEAEELLKCVEKLT
ncbi:MAG: hypothetical protein FRX48_08204 [Lasallia pustulata]|uniref:Uncharacterized protein n=1 Tax=Lasallia pustulata TaxID=136370 RepID=A0A5M8PFH1_9LECA|nr:MAG: hypothetical protein FRX48_08204 [Lasallia pustulata]